MPPVSVLMTVYNAGFYLQRAINSVLAQTLADWELRIMEDGSTDPLVSDVLAAVTDPRIRVARFQPTIEQRRAHCRYARLINLAARAAAGRYLTFLCGDDAYMPDRLARMVTMLDAGADVVYGAQQLCGEFDGDRGVRQTLGPLTRASALVDLNSVMLTRESFDRVGGFDEDPSIWRWADGVFWNKLTDAGYVFQPVPGGPTDVKTYRDQGQPAALSVDARVILGLDPWA